MCVVALRWRPPPTQRKRPDRTISMIVGGSDVSPRPQTNRGLTTTVSRPPASRTSCSAFAFDEEYMAAESGRSGAASSTFTSGWPAISAASVPTCTRRRTPASRQASITFCVPRTFSRSKSAGSPQSSTFAAAWNATSQPSAPARSESRSSRSPITGSAPSSRTRSPARSERASARTSQPARRSRSMSAPPTKPEPPVTKAAVMSALVARAGPERVAHRDRAGDLRLVAERVRVAVLVGEHRLGGHPPHLARAAEILVHDAGAAAALGDGRDHERLAGAGVTAREHSLDLGAVDGSLHVSAPVEVETKLVHRALVLRVVEADRDQHEVGALLEVAAGDGVQVARGAALHAPPNHAGHRPVDPTQRGHLRAEAAVAALVQGVGGGGALGRQRPRRAGRPAARRQLRVDVEQQHVLGALTQGVRDAVHPGVAAADHDHALALGADHLTRRRLTRRAPLGGRHGAVALVEVLHGVMHAGQLAPRDLE